MSEVVTQKLAQLVVRFGSSLAEDAQKTRGLLRDVCGESHNKEIIALVCVVSDGIAKELLSLQNKDLVHARIDRGSTKLQDHHGLAPALARWSVEAWAVALGILTVADIEARQIKIHRNLASTMQDDLVPGPIAAPTRTLVSSVGGKVDRTVSLQSTLQTIVSNAPASSTSASSHPQLVALGANANSVKQAVAVNVPNATSGSATAEVDKNALQLFTQITDKVRSLDELHQALLGCRSEDSLKHKYEEWAGGMLIPFWKNPDNTELIRPYASAITLDPKVEEIAEKLDVVISDYSMLRKHFEWSKFGLGVIALLFITSLYLMFSYGVPWLDEWMKATGFIHFILGMTFFGIGFLAMFTCPLLIAIFVDNIFHRITIYPLLKQMRQEWEKLGKPNS